MPCSAALFTISENISTTWGLMLAATLLSFERLSSNWSVRYWASPHRVEGGGFQYVLGLILHDGLLLASIFPLMRVFWQLRGSSWPWA